MDPFSSLFFNDICHCKTNAMCCVRGERMRCAPMCGLENTSGFAQGGHGKGILPKLGIVATQLLGRQCYQPLVAHSPPPGPLSKCQGGTSDIPKGSSQPPHPGTPFWIGIGSGAVPGCRAACLENWGKTHPIKTRGVCVFVFVFSCMNCSNNQSAS